jgi:hypothetical protein
VPEVSGEVVVSAPDSASIELRLATDTPYTETAGPAGLLAVEGKGRVVAAILRRTDSTKPTEGLVAARFNGCGTTGCTPASGEAPMDYFRPAEGQRRDPAGRRILEAGSYRLTVLTDGAPATARLRLEARRGAAQSLSAIDPVESAVVPAAQTVGLPVSASYWSGGAAIRIPTADSVLLGFFQQDSSLGTVAGAAGVCHFDGARPLLGHFAPGCPFMPGSSGRAQSGSVATEQLTLLSEERARLATFLPASQGGQEAGFWTARAGVSNPPLAFFAWARLS